MFLGSRPLNVLLSEHTLRRCPLDRVAYTLIESDYWNMRIALAEAAIIDGSTEEIALAHPSKERVRSGAQAEKGTTYRAERKRETRRKNQSPAGHAQCLSQQRLKSLKLERTLPSDV